MKTQTIAVMGAGQMGGGIAQVAATSGFDVILRDVEDAYVDRGLDAIRRRLERAVEKERMTGEERDAALERLRPTTDLGAAADADIVLEAITENPEIKKQLFRDLHEICDATTPFASNTSSIPITELATASGRPDRFIGMHFFNPVPVMKLVEVIRGEETPDDLTSTVLDLARSLGKTPVEVQDYPGFVSNRVLMPMINEAIFALHEGVATREAIDEVMKLGMNHPMGPLRLADFIGLDTCLAILNVLYEGFKDPKYRPCPLLVRKVQAGHLGDKTGRGFYEHDG